MKVILRKITLQDTANIVKWRNSEDVRKSLFTQDDLTEEMHINWFHSKVETGLCAQYIIEAEDEQGRHDVGTTFIKGIDYVKKNGEFGIFIGEASFRGKHLASDATKEMIKIGFEDLKLDTIFLSVFEENIPAICAYKKVGFEVLKDEGLQINGKHVILMNITREQWNKHFPC